MSDITLLLDAAGAGDRQAAADLLPLVYEELRSLAASKLARESPGQTLQPTALVHEAYLRLVGPQDADTWANRGHFFSAAATAMQRILIEAARRKSSPKHGGDCKRVVLSDVPEAARPDDLIALNDALTQFAGRDPIKAELVKLRFFGGLTMPQAASALGISLATAERYWAFAKAWLYAQLNDAAEPPTESP
jgi:RNA polymerase sigma factor (TIGR02999 family)